MTQPQGDDQQPQNPYDPYPQQPPPYGQPAYPPPPYGYAPDHPKATTSLVLGILGLVVCGFIAPFAWRVGKRTLDEIDGSQGRLGGRGQAQAGYILGIIGTAVLALGLVALVILVLLATVTAVSTSSGGS